ncbi:hypothetical protein F4811DRAFT_565387 [Daldinia bambusicola]|nr:hypothetical protein F4811DRAFT_565387 [Daldinia bambusicola]
MAIYWLLSLVCLLTPLSSAALGYSGGGIVDETVTESVTETVTKFLSQCGSSPAPLHTPDITITGTTTHTSTLKATISLTILASMSDISGAAPVDFSLSVSDNLFPTLNLSHPPLTTASSYSGLNYSVTHTNTTKIPCSTSTVLVPLVPSSHSTPCTTSFHSASSTTPTTTPPTQIPVSESTRLRSSTVTWEFLGTLSVFYMVITGFL